MQDLVESDWIDADAVCAHIRGLPDVPAPRPGGVHTDPVVQSLFFQEVLFVLR